MNERVLFVCPRNAEIEDCWECGEKVPHRIEVEAPKTQHPDQRYGISGLWCDRHDCALVVKP